MTVDDIIEQHKLGFSATPQERVLLAEVIQLREQLRQSGEVAGTERDEVCELLRQSDASNASLEIENSELKAMLRQFVEYVGNSAPRSPFHLVVHAAKEMLRDEEVAR